MRAQVRFLSLHGRKEGAAGEASTLHFCGVGACAGSLAWRRPELLRGGQAPSARGWPTRGHGHGNHLRACCRFAIARSGCRQRVRRRNIRAVLRLPYRAAVPPHLCDKGTASVTALCRACLLHLELETRALPCGLVPYHVPHKSCPTPSTSRSVSRGSRRSQWGPSLKAGGGSASAGSISRRAGRWRTPGGTRSTDSRPVHAHRVAAALIIMRGLWLS